MRDQLEFEKKLLEGKSVKEKIKLLADLQR
jgi:hypothetical protein